MIKSKVAIYNFAKDEIEYNYVDDAIFVNKKIIIPIEARTKKNSQQLITIKTKYGKNRTIPIPSKQYLEFEKACKPYLENIDLTKKGAFNLDCVFYMKTKRKVDLPNLLNSICDMLVHHKVISDDNSKIVYSFDGSCVNYDKENPRVVINISWYEKIDK